jgi:polyisoprenoid-binding protein YceI
MLRFVMTRAGLLAAAGVTLVMTACGSAATNQAPAPTTAPLATQGAPTVQPVPAAAQPDPTASQATAQPATAAQQSQAAQPTQASATVRATQAANAAQPIQPAQPGATTRLVIDSSASKASYRAREQLVGRTLPSEAVGTTTNVSGSLVLAADGSILADQSNISVDLSKLQSDESRRDNFIKGSTLQTSRFPMATFVPREAQGLPSPLPTSGEATFQLVGDLTVHGVTRPVTWQVTAQFGAATVSGAATTSVNISDFGMTPPKAGPVLSIEDGLTLELAFTAAREA